mgnify:CR=1 FL=1
MKLTILLVILIYFSQLAQAGELVVVVGANCPVSALNKEQVKSLFLGRAATFPDNSQATPIEQIEGSEQRGAFHATVTDKSDSQLKAYWSKLIFSGKATPPREVANPAEVVKLLGTNPNMIGYVSKDQIDGSVKVVFSP